MYGGQVWMSALKRKCSHENSVKNTKRYFLLHHYTPGNGRSRRGLGFMWTRHGLSLVRCFCSLWILILSGWTFVLWNRLHHRLPLRDCDRVSVCSACQKCWYLRMEHVPQVLKQNGSDHVRSAPFHPSSNGLAERAVWTFKEGMKKIKGDTLQTRLSRFLFSYRITPHATTGLSPAELMMSRRLRSAFDLLMPDVKTKV